jgi:hypothetical protein
LGKLWWTTLFDVCLSREDEREEEFSSVIVVSELEMEFELELVLLAEDGKGLEACW